VAARHVIIQLHRKAGQLTHSSLQKRLQRCSGDVLSPSENFTTNSGGLSRATISEMAWLRYQHGLADTVIQRASFAIFSAPQTFLMRSHPSFFFCSSMCSFYFFAYFIEESASALAIACVLDKLEIQNLAEFMYSEKGQMIEC
jgi:hypothetical protein